MKSIKQLAQALATTATLLLAQPIQAETYYFHNDHLGTPQALTDDSGTVVWQGSYSPFGEATESTAEVEQNIRFPGQYFEEETGLHYNYYRDYDPGAGRYIESDPIGLQGGINTFGYVGGMPLLYMDRLGLAGGRTCEWTNSCNNNAFPFPTFAGIEIMAGVGFGFVDTVCCTEDGNRQKMRFQKVCYGPSFNVGGSFGVVGGYSGKKCKPDSYSGGFVEFNLGPIGVDLGNQVPGPGILSGGATGTNEIGIGIGVGGGVAGCMYELISEETIGRCNGCPAK